MSVAELLKFSQSSSGFVHTTLMSTYTPPCRAKSARRTASDSTSQRRYCHFSGRSLVAMKEKHEETLSKTTRQAGLLQTQDWMQARLKKPRPLPSPCAQNIQMMRGNADWDSGACRPHTARNIGFGLCEMAINDHKWPPSPMFARRGSEWIRGVTNGYNFTIFLTSLTYGSYGILRRLDPSPPGSGHSVSGNNGQRRTVLRTTSCGRQKPAVTTKASSDWPCTGHLLLACTSCRWMDDDGWR